jgi:hypothetical protein
MIYFVVKCRKILAMFERKSDAEALAMLEGGSVIEEYVR